MGFFTILMENGMDWEKSRDIFYNLNDIQIAWLNAVSKRKNKGIERSNPTFGNVKEEKKTFNMRGG